MARASGMHGAVTFGPIAAATVHDWTMTREHDGERGRWQFSAKVSIVDSYYITQAPLTLSLQMGRSQWRWQGVALEIVGSSARGVLVGRPEIL